MNSNQNYTPGYTPIGSNDYFTRVIEEDEEGFKEIKVQIVKVQIIYEDTGEVVFDNDLEAVNSMISIPEDVELEEGGNYKGMCTYVLNVPL